MFHFFNKKDKTSLLGIDLNPNYIAIVELIKEKNHKFKLNNYAYKPLIGGWMSEEFVKEEEQLGQFISNILHSERIKTKRCAISLPTQSVMRKTFEIDKKMKEREIENAIIHSGKKYIIHNIDEVYFDFKVISDPEDDDDNQEVLLVASKKKNITTREDALVIAGLEPKIVDIEQYAMERGLSLVKYQINKELNIDLENKEHSIIVFIDIMDSKVKLDLYVNDKFGYSIEEGLEYISVKNTSIKRNLNSGGLKLKNQTLNEKSSDIEDSDELEISVEDYTEEQIKYYQIIKKLMNKVNYSFLDNEKNNSVDAIILKGNNDKIDEILPILNEKIDIPSIKINPTLTFEPAQHINLFDLEKNASNLLLACCLGIRED